MEYAQLRGKITEVAAADEQTADALKQVEKHIADMDLLIKNMLLNPNALRAEYDKLTQEKDRLYKEYGMLKKQVKQLDTLKANVDKILNVSGQGKEPEQEQDKRSTVDANRGFIGL